MGQNRQLKLSPYPVILIFATIQGAGRKQQKEMRSFRHFFTNLVRPLAGVDRIHIEENIVAMMCEFLLDYLAKARPVESRR